METNDEACEVVSRGIDQIFPSSMFAVDEDIFGCGLVLLRSKADYQIVVIHFLEAEQVY